MKRRLQASDSGPAVNRWLIGNALIQAHEALDDDILFGSRIEWAMSAAAELFGDTEDDFQEAYRELLVDRDGNPLRPGDSIPRSTRYRMVREIKRRGAESGLWDYKKGDFSDATSVFEDVLDADEA